MKFPEEPESTRAGTATEHSGVNSCTVNKKMDVMAASKLVSRYLGLAGRH